jgi:hypothetical protein
VQIEQFRNQGLEIPSDFLEHPSTLAPIRQPEKTEIRDSERTKILDDHSSFWFGWIRMSGVDHSLAKRASGLQFLQCEIPFMCGCGFFASDAWLGTG